MRSKLLHRNSDKYNDQNTCTSDDETASTLVPKSTDSDPQNINNMADMLTTTLAIKYPVDPHLSPPSTSVISTSSTSTPVTSLLLSMSSNVRETLEATHCDDKSRPPGMVSCDSAQVLHTPATLKIKCCCCLPTPMTLASGGSPMFPLVVHQPASPSIWPAVQSLRRGLSTNPGATMWCVCGCS